VTGNGSVLTVATRQTQRADKSALRCGTAGFLCYAQFTARRTLQFVAKPDPGYRFANWGGACFGQGARCRLIVGAPRSLSATFVPVDPDATATVTLHEPRVSVRWRRSVGTGQLAVSGTVSRPALIRLDFRRPAGGPLLTQQQSVRAGRFSLVPQISRAALPKGAMVLPGGFVVVLTGRVGSVALPRVLRTVVLPPPPEGVVRRAYTGASRNGRAAASLRYGARVAYTTFVYASQPRRGKHVGVRWFAPDGKPIGTTEKANRPTVQTTIWSGATLPKGRYVVELWSDEAVVAAHTVTIQ
jgi:hypothetical protein